jgi:F-type H+-transporting ATPase subunit b
MEQVAATLGINWRDFFLHLINFGVLIGLLWWLLYKPVVGMLDDRRQRIADSMERAEQVRIEAERANQEREAQLANTRRQIQEMLAQATQMSERIHAEARRESDAIIARAREEAQAEAAAERARTMAELRREVATLAVMAAERVISRNLDEQAQHRLIEEFLAEQPAGDGRR